MNPTVTQRESCRLCGSAELELVLPLAPSAIADAFVPAERLGEIQEVYPLDLHLCLACGHVQLLTVINPEVLFGDYIYDTASSPGLVDHFRRYADEVTDRFRPAPGSLVMDVGSNDGTLLRFFQQRGMKVLGIDAASGIARKATEAGVETLGAFFTSKLARRLREERGAASVVTANNVFAHADDLGDVAEGVRALLAPDGVFIFEVSYLADMVDNMVFDWIYHEHLCYHSIRPLCSFFQRHGLELIDVQRVSTKGGSMRVFVQRAGGPRDVAPAVGEFLEREATSRLDRPEPFRAFADRIDAEKRRLHELLSGLRSREATIGGYGASATATTLIHHFGLGPLLDFIADDNPSRQGLFSPGHHIPIVAPDVLYEQRPAGVIILAWRFADAITKKHEVYRARGGRFFVPLPRARVV